MKHHRLLPAIMAVLLAAIAARAEPVLPPIVQAAIEAARKDCTLGPVKLLKGFVAEKDVNADGRKDFILDYGKFQCGDTTQLYCGTGGCLIQVFASRRDGHVKALDENVRQVKFARINGKPALLLELHGSACGKAGVERCRATRIWNGEDFVGTR